MCLVKIALEMMFNEATLKSRLLGGLMDKVLTKVPREKEKETRANEKEVSCLCDCTVHKTQQTFCYEQPRTTQRESKVGSSQKGARDAKHHIQDSAQVCFSALQKKFAADNT